MTAAASCGASGGIITCSAVVELRAQLESLRCDDVLVDRMEVDETLVWNQTQMTLDQMLFPRFRPHRSNPVPLLGYPPRGVLEEVVAGGAHAPPCVRKLHTKIMLSDEVVGIVQDAAWNMLSLLHQHSVMDRGRRKYAKRAVHAETWKVLRRAFEGKASLDRSEFFDLIKALGIKMKRGQLDQTIRGLSGETSAHVTLEAIEELVAERPMHASVHEDDALLRGRISERVAAIMLRYPLRVRDVLAEPMAEAVSLAVYRIVSKALLPSPVCDPLSKVIRVFVKKSATLWVTGIPASLANVGTKEWLHIAEHSIDSRIDCVLVGETTFVKTRDRIAAKERRGRVLPRTPVPPHNTPAAPHGTVRFTSAATRAQRARACPERPPSAPAPRKGLQELVATAGHEWAADGVDAASLCRFARAARQRRDRAMMVQLAKGPRLVRRPRAWAAEAVGLVSEGPAEPLQGSEEPKQDEPSEKDTGAAPAGDDAPQLTVNGAAEPETVRAREGGDSPGGVSTQSALIPATPHSASFGMPQPPAAPAKRGHGGAPKHTLAADLRALDERIQAVRDNAKKFKPCVQRPGMPERSGGADPAARAPRRKPAGKFHFAKAHLWSQFGVCANSPYFLRLMEAKGIPPAPPTRDRRWDGRLTWLQSVQ